MMKRLLFLSLALLWSVPGWAAWPTPIQAWTANIAAGSATTVTLAYTSNITAGSLLACFVEEASARTISSVADSQSQTWSNVATELTLAGVVKWSLWYFAGSVAGANTVTVTFDMASSARGIVCAEFGPAAASPLDRTTQQVIVTPGTGTDAVTTGNTAATSVANELVIAGAISATTNTLSSGTLYTEGYQNTSAHSAESIEIEYKLQAAPAAVAGTWTQSNNKSVATIVATFKPVVSSTVNRGLLLGVLP